jgi:hypothetical protein
MNTELGKEIKERFELASLPSHMTHIDNLNSILTSNGLFSVNTLNSSSLPFNDSSNASVQVIRANKTIPDTGKPLHDYVPLYFGLKTPLVSAIRNLNDSLVFLFFSFDILNDLECVISDGNAADAKTSFKVLQSIDDLDFLDPKSINSQSYAHDNEIKRRKQAELLILDFLPISYLKYVICPSDMVKMTVDTNPLMANLRVKTYVGGKSYYYK